MFKRMLHATAAPVIAVSFTGAAALFLAAATPASAKLACEGITAAALGLPQIAVVSSQSVPKGEKSPVPHCLIEATTAERTGVDGKPYAVRFEMRLPDDWNGDFFHQLNGGDNGDVIPAMGPLLGGNKARTGLSRGYAVLSSDGGHDGKAQPEAGQAAAYRFALDPEARAFFGYKTVETLAPIAKKLIASYYGSAPEHSYAVGCSNGGRHALVAAERLASEYDGILAGAPGYNLPRAAVQHALDVQSFKAVNGDVRTAFSREDLALVAGGIGQACDKFDGLEDGIVQDSKACQAAFDIGSLQCKDGQNSACLKPEQVEALRTVHAGPINSKGEQLYSDWAWDIGIGGGNWRFWKLESSNPAWEKFPLIVARGAASLSYLFTTPPTETGGSIAELEKFLLDFDLDRDAPKINATDGAFTQSAMDVIAPPNSGNPTLGAFKQAGGKMIVFHGISDPVFSANDTLSWYEKLAGNNGGSAADFVKYYPVPGMTHCSGGPATDDFDLFSELVGWVEGGKEPQAVKAGLSAENKDIPQSWSAARTRKLCAWPQVARFQSGDPESADSFACTQ